MSSVNIQLEGRLVRPATGPGAKIIQGVVILGTASEALHASDMGLMKMHTVLVQPGGAGTFITCDLASPGSARNYASFTAYGLGVNAGTLNAVSAGSTTLYLAVIGE